MRAIAVRSSRAQSGPQEASWHEDNRRVANGEQTRTVSQWAATAHLAFYRATKKTIRNTVG
jgi:hypothetical protein